MPPVRVALAGNPNSGKTSLFNALTGARQHVGNYPGVTVEKRTGTVSDGGLRLELQDLPGTYSLTSFSPEERIAHQELLQGHHDVVVVVVDSTALERSLVLLTQVVQTGANPVLCLNMSDEAEQAGQRIDIEQMRSLLGFPVVQTVGHKGAGAKQLLEAIQSAAATPTTGHRLVFGERMEQALAAIRKRLEAAQSAPAAVDWIATRLLIGEGRFADRMRAAGQPGLEVIEEAERQRRRIEELTGLDISLFVTEQYFGFVDGLLKEVLLSPPRRNARAISDAIDEVLAHRALGLPIFAAVMYAIFWLTFRLGEPPMGWIEAGFDALGGWIGRFWPAGSGSVLRSLLVDGVVGGVGGVVVFLPNILLLFLGLALLEDTGYMARVAFLMDRVMHRFGLHGKSFVPMMTGFGCSVPGIMATRTLENERDRLTTMLVLPLMSCGARLPIWMLLIPAFFTPSWRAPMLFFIYAVGIALAFLLALALRSSILKGEEAPFVMELPPYRLPTTRAVVTRMAERGWLYLQKAGTVILGISILMWLLAAFPRQAEHPIDARIAAGEVQVVAVLLPKDVTGEAKAALEAEAMKQARRNAGPGVRLVTEAEAARERAMVALRYSIAGRIGRALEPALRPLGLDWRTGTALIGAFAAKEVFVAQLGIVYSLGETDEESADLRTALQRDYSPLTGLSLMLFLLVSAPCMATIAVTRRESGSWRWAMLQLGGLTVVAYLLSLVVFQSGRLLMGA